MTDLDLLGDRFETIRTHALQPLTDIVVCATFLPGNVTKEEGPTVYYIYYTVRTTRVVSFVQIVHPAN